MDLSWFREYNQEVEQNGTGKLRLRDSKKRLGVQEHYLKGNVFPKWYCTGTGNVLEYRSNSRILVPFRYCREEFQNAEYEHVDDVRARFDRSLRRVFWKSNDTEASPVWTGLGLQVVKINREGSVSHGHTSFSL
jgi:hypothetical protein